MEEKELTEGQKAILNKFAETVKALTSKYVDVSVGNPPEEAATAALHFAAWCGALSVVENGADVKAVERMGFYFTTRFKEVLMMMLEQHLVESQRDRPN